MTEYTSSRALARRLIRKKGRAINVVVNTNGTPPDALKPWNRPIAAADPLPTYGVFTGYDTKRIDGVSIQRGDQELMLYADGDDGIDFVLTTKDTIIDTDTSVWRIVDVDVIRPGPEIVAQTLKVRR